jgi:hypothetical protein
MFENFNSIGVGTQDWKVDRLNKLIKEHGIDVIAGCETNIDWRQVDSDHQLLDLLVPGMGKCGVISNNITGDLLHRAQRGGTMIAALGRLCDAITSTNGMGSDPTKLARFSWISLGNGTVKTKVVSAYMPCRPPSNSKGETTWEQQQCYFESIGDFRDPDEILLGDLLAQIKLWREAGEQVILALDANQNVYDGPLGQALSEPPYNMHCLLESATGSRVPNSHFRGKDPITTIFGSAGLVVGDGMCYPHWYGVGDHRVFVVEVSAESLFGGKLPTVGLHTSRTLNCQISRSRRNYNRVLKALADRHNMYGKLLKLKSLDDTTSVADYQLMHNKWDNELGDFMASAEDQCTKFKSCQIEYSPTVGVWLKRRSILKWILRWHDGKVPDARNLLRAATRNGIDNPLGSTREEIEARLVACIGEIFKLKKDAPELRRKHLLACLSRARARNDDLAVQEILRIRRKECDRKRQLRINAVLKPARGRAVMAIQVEEDGELHTYDTHEDIVRVVNSRIGARYRLGSRSPANFGQIAEDLGHFADTEAAQKILDGTYVFPADTDPALKDILVEAARIRVEFEDCPASPNPVTVEEFIDFWHSANQRTASSDSGRHFGHYIAASDDPEVALLHVESLNIASARGLPLDRWKSGLTVLIEKVAGNIFVDKLRAICLLEADFNWWLKLIFARRMMEDIRAHNMIPVEQIATTGRSAIDGAMVKQIGFYDCANTLHITAKLDSIDAQQCYDCVTHSTASIGLQAHGIPIQHILLYLGCMAEMCYHLKTGFNRDEQGFSGMFNLFNGLGQGSGGAPPVWQVVSALMLCAYRAHGHAVTYRTAWSGLVFTIAAILYVDDCDLLHLCVDPDMSEEEFLRRKQWAMYYWGLLLQATGGMLTQKKCFWYLLSYKFVRGEARLRRLSELKHVVDMYIPQHDGTKKAIELVDVTEARETLGVFTSPDSTPKPKSAKDRRSRHLQKMVGKGEEWCRKVTDSSLPTRDIWRSFSTQAKPSFQYGNVVLMDSPTVVRDAFNALYFKCLPALGVNRCITRGWRMLPVSFQGLGLPNMALEKLSDSLMWLQRHWEVKEGVGLVVREAYERLQVETGLSGNVFARDYKTYECLATHTWFKVFWQYLDHFGVKLELDSSFDVPAVRERDVVLMDEATQALPRSEWRAFNRVRKHKKVFFKSQLAHCDGICVNMEFLSRATGSASTMVFSKEEPTPSDFRLWESTITLLSSPTLRFSPPFGKFLRQPYDNFVWYTTSDRRLLVRKCSSSGGLTVFLPSTPNMATRRGSHYTPSNAPLPVNAALTFFATVIPLPDGSMSIHSVARLPCRTATPPPSNLRAAIAELPNQSLWSTLNLDGDGEWILDAMVRGTLVIVHDGSYMEELDRSACSAGGVIFCTQVRRMATFSAAERTHHRTASNYRGELLGGLLASLILKAASSLLSAEVRPVYIACDNMGVVLHGNNRHRSLKEAQKQADIIRCFRSILASLPFQIIYEHVYGHQDDSIPWSQLTLFQQLNVIVDKLAKDALVWAIRNNTFISSCFPYESLRIFVNGVKITSSIRSALYDDWGKKEARRLFDKREIVSASNFDLIYWDGVSAAMEVYPRMFQVWVTKLVSHFCGTNRQLSRIDPNIENVCPCCGEADESVGHVTRCLDDGRTKMFEESCDLFLDFLHDTHMDLSLVSCFEEYLYDRGISQMTDITSHLPFFSQVAHDIDALGWDNLLEGRIPHSLVDLQSSYLRRSKSFWKIKTWASHCTQHLLNITHRQWLYRNARIHLRKVEGLTTADHLEVFLLVKKMMLVDPSDLLPQHRRLLELDFQQLGEGPTIDRKMWLQQMNSALLAADSVRDESGDNDRTSTAAASTALVTYARYREESGIAATKRSNMAKRVRLT